MEPLSRYVEEYKEEWRTAPKRTFFIHLWAVVTIILLVRPLF